MTQIIHSQALQDKLANVKWKTIRNIYGLCIGKYLDGLGGTGFETVVWKSIEKEEAIKEIQEQAMRNIDIEYAQAKVPHPFYYFDSMADNKWWAQVFLMAPNEEILLKIFTDKLLVIA